MDERGNVIDKQDVDSNVQEETPDSRMLGGIPKTSGSARPQKDYTPIDKYKPTGTLIYNQEMFEKIGKKIGI